MESSRGRSSAVLSTPAGPKTHEISRATSPGGDVGEDDSDHQIGRSRPRAYPYFKYLPYKLEDESERQRNLQQILRHLYIAVEAGDFNPGAVHWTRELRGWLSLKFDPTKKQRIKLVKLYYELALAPGIHASVAERFASMFMLLTKYACSSIALYP